jgi:hypothetical protein
MATAALFDSDILHTYNQGLTKRFCKSFFIGYNIGTTFRLGPKSAAENGCLGKAEIEPWNKPVPLIFRKRVFARSDGPQNGC